MPTGRVGNYSAPVDTAGMDPSMQAMMTGKRKGQTGDSATDKAEKAFTGSAEAVRRARKANRQPPLKED